MPNGTAPPATVVVPQLATLISITGADRVTLSGLTVTHSLTTFLGEYTVPSGGDWSMHRGGAVFVTDASGLHVEGCHFTRTGGNAVMLSDRVRAARFEGAL
eukprot:SAG22_NODE_54_length_23787_cov_12.917511_17_plen_101_part_00